MQAGQEKPEVGRFQNSDERTLGMVQGIAPLALKPYDDGVCAGWGAKGRASRVGEADFTP